MELEKHMWSWTLAAVVSVLAGTCSNTSAGEAYGKKVHFERGRSISFPNFTITYSGDRTVATSSYPRGFLYRDFVVNDGKTSTISWSSGTGDIAPKEFQAAGKRFALELGLSEKLGSLGQDTLVIWKR